MICVECAAPVKSLYTYYSGDNIHATKCEKCGQFADRYLECDNLLVVIDLLLLRPAAIRHVVFNAEHEAQYGTKSDAEHRKHTGHRKHAGYFGMSVTVSRLLLLVVLFDVYLEWAMSEKSNVPFVLKFLLKTHPAVQYVLFLALSVLETLSAHVVVRKLATWLIRWQDGPAVSTALLICSFFKLLPILTFIWHYDIPFVGQLVQYVSLVCTVEVLAITLDCGYFIAGLLTLAARGLSIGLKHLFWRLIALA